MIINDCAAEEACAFRIFTAIQRASQFERRMIHDEVARLKNGARGRWKKTSVQLVDDATVIGYDDLHCVATCDSILSRFVKFQMKFPMFPRRYC